MPHLTIFELEGDPEELLEAKRTYVDRLARDEARAAGGIAHMVARTDNGLIVFNLFESAEGAERVAEKVRPAATAAGLPQPAFRREYELEQYEGPAG